LFSQVDVSLNERLISPSTNTYPYRAMIETLLNYGEEAKTNRLMLNGVNLRIKLNRAKNSFCLMSPAAAPTFKVVITEAILFLSQDAGNQISRSDYGSGYTAFCFDLSPDHCSGDHFELIKQGNLRAELHFKEPLANTVNLIVYAEFQNVIEIDG
ncbi:unnamed protein product, partial [Porites lobata]